MSTSTSLPVGDQNLGLFFGGTGGIDSLLETGTKSEILDRLASLTSAPLSRSAFNQYLALSHQAEISEGFFRYYWLDTPKHTYDVSQFIGHSDTYTRLSSIHFLDQFVWGLYRLYVDCLLYFGSVKHGFNALRTKSRQQLEEFYQDQCFDVEALAQRGPSLLLEKIPQDSRYLIAEMACKSFEPQNEEDADLLMILKGAWREHEQSGGGRVTARKLLDSAYVLREHHDQQIQFQFAADEILDEEVETEEQLVQKYTELRGQFSDARKAALRNTELYLSMAHDLDVYVATSMRSREQFRQMARVCEAVFSDEYVSSLNLRYFDPTLSAARGHEDKGLIECLMVKCAKALLFTAGDRDSYGKDSEAAMALSLGKPVIFFCDEESRGRFFSEVHPLSRLVEFESGVAVGVMVTSDLRTVAQLLSRIFNNRMEYILEQPRKGYFRLREKLTNSTIRLQTDDMLLRETFWNCYNRPRV